MKKGFESDPVQNKKYLKPKIKSYEGKISTHFHGDKASKEGSESICLSITFIQLYPYI